MVDLPLCSCDFDCFDSYDSYDSYNIFSLQPVPREAYASRAATVFNELKKPYVPSAEDSVGSVGPRMRGQTPGFALSSARVLICLQSCALKHQFWILNGVRSLLVMFIEEIYGKFMKYIRLIRPSFTRIIKNQPNANGYDPRIQVHDIQKTTGFCHNCEGFLVNLPVHQVDYWRPATEVIVQATGNALTKAVTAAEAPVALGDASCSCGPVVPLPCFDALRSSGHVLGLHVSGSHGFTF